MRLYAGKVTPISTEVVRALLASNDIEAEAPREAEADVAAVLNGYLTTEREVNERAKDLLEKSGRPGTELGRMRQLVADEKGIKLGDEALDYLLDQVVAVFHHSRHVDEIYAEDVELRRKMAPIFKRHMAIDAGMDTEARAQLKHLKEGTPAWDIEYGRALDRAKRKKGA
jgi:hypothetical protein